MRTLIFFGAPGSGKGTLSKRFSQHYKTSIVSTGDMLRKQVHEKTSLGKKVQETLSRGSLVADTLVQSILVEELASQQSRHLLLDGFPRTVTQAEWLCSALSKLGRAADAVVHLDVPEDVILKRIEDRWIHAPSGRTYNMSFNPPKVEGVDDVTGEALSKRADDDLDTIKARIEAFNETTTPILSYYRKKGLLKTVTGETSDQLFPQIQTSLKPLFL
ncbi:hypothetical protein HDU81_004423 [Chytriomyces hyalinus]|nr:hypothetical protein HDU81_004423 [Chytriomyces hyalinus]